MKQGMISRLLRILCFLMGIIGVGFFFVFMPKLIDDFVCSYQEIAFLRYPAYFFLGGVVVTCYYILYQFYTITIQIGYMNSFCKENVLALKRMANASLGLIIIFILGDVYLLFVNWLHPFLLLCSFFFCFVIAVFMVICYCLSSLLSNVVMIKKENDLTV